MTLAEARNRFDRAKRSLREGNGPQGFQAAAECWNEARSHKGDPAWDAFGTDVFAELPKFERAASRSERSDPSDSTTLILK
jgi:hypothetical protein